MSAAPTSLPSLRRRRAGHYTTADGRWKLFVDPNSKGQWQINAMTAPDARWLRENGLVKERFPTRNEALRTLMAWAHSAPDLPAASEDTAAKVRPLRRDEARWLIADGSIAFQRPMAAKMRGSNRGWVALGTQESTRMLLERAGLGTRTFSRLDEASVAVAAVLDNQVLIDLVNQDLTDRHKGQMEVYRRMSGQKWREKPDPPELLIRLSER